MAGEIITRKVWKQCRYLSLFLDTAQIVLDRKMSFQKVGDKILSLAANIHHDKYSFVD